MQKLYDFIRRYIDFTNEEALFLSAHIKEKRFKKGETIHRMGDVFNTIMLIHKGIARSFVIKEDGKDFTWYFHFSDQDSANLKNFFIVDYASFTHQEPSMMSFEALQDCEVYVIEHAFLESLYGLDIKWQYMGRVIAQEAYYITHHRTVSLLTLTASERLDRLIQEYPLIFEHVAHYHIASFLGIAPQHLSRLRRS
jgi:CRP-like cAMP-binding protein